MTHQMFSVYDSKAEAYLPPFQADTLGLAERMFQDTINDPRTPFHKHPEDYTLYHIGTFDSHTAQLSSGKHTVVINGKQLLVSSHPEPTLSSN